MNFAPLPERAYKMDKNRRDFHGSLGDALIDTFSGRLFHMFRIDDVHLQRVMRVELVLLAI